MAYATRQRARRVLAPREHLVEVLDELRLPPESIEDHRGVVIFDIAHGGSTSIYARCAASISAYVNTLFVAGSGRNRNWRCVQRRVTR
jgi:hypothetical protein